MSERLTREEQDQLVEMCRRKGRELRGRSGILYWMGYSPLHTGLDTIRRDSWQYAMDYLAKQPDAARKAVAP